MHPEAGEKRQRLFFALWPDHDLRRSLAQIAEHAVQGRGRLIPVQDIHLTLAFLGALDAARCACMESAAESVSVPAFELELVRLGHWPTPRVVWSAAKAIPEALDALVSALRRGMAGCGLKPESRGFKAHLTLARKVRLPGEFSLSHDPLRWRVADFHLVASQTLPTGAHYHILRSWLLGNRKSGAIA